MPISISQNLQIAIIAFIISFFVCFIVLFINSYFKLWSSIKVFYKFLLSIFFISVMPLTIFSVSRYKALGVYTIEIQTSKLEAITDLKVEIIQNFFSDISAQSSTIQNSPRVKANFPNLLLDNSELDREKAKQDMDSAFPRLVENEKLLDIVILDQDKKLIYSTGNFYKSDNDILAVKGFKSLGKEVKFSEPFAVQSDMQMYIGGPLNLENDQLGSFLLIFSLNEFYDQIQSLGGLGRTGEVVLGKNFGESIVVLNKLRNQEGAELNLSIKVGDTKSIPLQKSSAKHESGNGLVLDYRGEEVLAVWRYLPQLDWGMVVKMDKEEVIEPVTSLRLALVTFLGVVTFVILLTSFFLAYSIVGRIEMLSIVMEKISNGEDVSWSEVKEGGHDEIGRLILGIKKMVVEMDKTQKELKKRVEELSRFSRVTIGRELRMAELKKEIKMLKGNKEK